MNAFAIVLCAVLAVANAGVLVHQSVPVLHSVPVVHAVPVVHTIVPAARSSSFSYRAAAAKLLVPVAHHPVAVHSVHTPVIAHHQLHHVSPIVMHQVLLH